ncbi:MAG: bifunctional phosphoribosyl-AMP cyclohydrolase/phosphoribosyl-ATP diphosphatase HisIE [Acidobacteria bacterium]|nr:bifunctional phosphoribosyl-AMP cyclohydrolase/phosphoribosyl-ATP diphosphatase HisIE [Acidobacteriota bacterium]
MVQDVETRRVLMLGFMNAEALLKTEVSGRVTFYSRTKKRLWTKGETSGNFLDVVSITSDCDEDTLLLKAKPDGPVCHTGAETCFGESNLGDKLDFLSELEATIEDRRSARPEDSYVAKLFAKGLNKIAQKVGEEAVETVISAKDEDQEAFKNEAADLLFHLIVLLNAKNTSLDEITEVLQRRHQPRGTS